MSRGSAAARISASAGDQWGMVTAGQARRRGVSRVDLARLVADGTLAVVQGAARVYRLTGAPENPDLDPVRAAWLQLGGSKSWEERIADPDAIVSHRSAAHVRGWGDLTARVHEFYVPVRRRPRRTDIKLRVRPHLDPERWDIWSGLPVCTAETIVDDLLSEHEDESAVAQIVHDAIRDGLLDQDAVAHAISGHERAYGHTTTEQFVAIITGEETHK